MSPFKETFEKILQEAFGIRPGEMERGLLMQANIFLIISTLLIVKPTVTALFLTEFGVEKLPEAFIFVALAAAIVSTVYSRLLVRYHLKTIIHRTTLFSVVSLVFFGIFLKVNVFVGPVLYLFYVWVAIFALLSTSQFWVLANMVFNAREAKRLFSFIGAGAIAGGIFGGYLTSVLAQLMSSENLAFVAAILLSVCLPISKKIWEEHLADKLKPAPKHQKQSAKLGHPFQLIRQSKHLTYLAGIVGVSVVVAKLVDYQFGGVAAKLIPDPDELTSFLGFWFSTFNLISLLLQLFLTRRIVGTYGVGASLFFLPSLIFIAAALLLAMPELLLAAIFLKMSDGSLKQSVNKAAMELIILPIPTEVKNQTKTFIDVFVDSMATGLSGILLIGMVDGLELSTRSISLLILFFIGLWLYLASRVRKEYVQSFKLKLEQAAGEQTVAKKEFDLQSASAVLGLKRVLKIGGEKQLVFVLQKIQEMPREDFLDPIRELLKHPASEVRAEAIATLFLYHRHELSMEILPLTKDPSQKVKIQAFEYLLARPGHDHAALMEYFLNDPDPNVRSAALVSLAQDNQDNPRLKKDFGLEKMIREKIRELPNLQGSAAAFEKITVAKAIGYANLPVLHEHLFHLLTDENEEVVKNTILAAAETHSFIFTEKIVRFLAVEKYRPTAQQALANYGKSVVPELAQMMTMPDIPIEALRIIPACVKLIPEQPSVDFLFDLLDFEDAVVRQEALRSLNALHNQNTHLHFDKKDIVQRILTETKIYQDTISALFVQSNVAATSEVLPVSEKEAKKLEARTSLIRLLGQRLDRNLERIFRLLGLKYPSEEILVIYQSLRSNKDDLRTNAVEFLDNLLEHNLKKVIIPIIETTMLETISEEAIKNLDVKIPDEYECFQRLLSVRDVRIKLAVLYLIGQLGEPHYIPLVEEALKQNQPKIREFAGKVLGEMTF